MIPRGSGRDKTDSRATIAKMVHEVIEQVSREEPQRWTARPTITSTATWGRVVKERNGRAIKVRIAANLAQIRAVIGVAACLEEVLAAAASEAAAADGANSSRMIVVRPSSLAILKIQS